MKRKSESGVLSLEAAIVMPFFIILMLGLDGLILFFMGQQIMTHTAIQTAKSMAFDPYSAHALDEDAADGLSEMFNDIASALGRGYTSTKKWNDEETDEIPDVAKERFTAFLRGSKSESDGLLEQIGVPGGVDSIDFSGTKVEDGFLLLDIKYTQEFPFNTLDLASFDRHFLIKVKLFV